MSVVIMFLAGLAAFGGWWLARQRLMTAKPWLEQGVIDGVPDFEASHDPAKRAGLGFFLAVVGSMLLLWIYRLTTRTRTTL